MSTAPTVPPSTARQPRIRARQVSHGTGFWFATVAFTALTAFGTAPVALWPLYQARDGFGATMVTVAYGIVVVGAALSFVTLGHLSDRFGRRPVMVSALLVAIVAALVLLIWPDLPGLLTGRFLNGVGIGLMSSTAATYLHDLYHREHPDRPHSSLPGIIVTAANLGGLALGPLVAGIIAQWLPSPLLVTQGLFAAVMAISVLLTLHTPETVHRKPRTESAPIRFALRPGGRPVFIAAGGLGFFSFAVFGLFSSLGATMLHVKLGIDSHFIAGLAPFVMFAAATVGQLALSRLSLRPLLTLGATVFPLGLALAAVSLYHPQLWLYLVAAALTGAGAGLLFKGGVVQTASVAEPASRAGVLAMYFVIGYIGMGVPAVIFSIIIKHLSINVTMIGFAALLSVGAALSVMRGLRSSDR
ncbi:MFS transporter [Streptomyces sp. NPDC051569]|uniref:MFS transporter n=1 Tax=Streptomyces sp. NPDC051569 TaxID=3365661 RepID=UPI00379D93F8